MKDTLKRLFGSVLALVVLFSTSYLSVVTVYADTNSYYIDSQNGSDNNTGKSADNAWKTFTNVNAATFLPGDKILLKRGNVFSGTLYPKGSGTAANPIIIGAYGTGSLPVINGNGARFNPLTNNRVDAAAYLANVSHLFIENLEVTNEIPDTLSHGVPYDFSSTDDRSGIHVDATAAGTYTGITIRNCVVHHVSSDGNDVDHARMAGINVWARSWNASFTNVLIENTRFIPPAVLPSTSTLKNTRARQRGLLSKTTTYTTSAVTVS
ncbi:MAG: hypothetical protein BGN88_13775 [Clostridiales bacterium 43-6]|nr:MAG: hypothetical protein BGN88_13775 [Clostridiales bacterium 43-6]